MLALPLALAVAAAPADLVKDRLIPATPAAVWKAWTTREGAARFFAPDARIEPRAGGAFEIYFAPGAPEGQRGTEGCTVVAAEAQKKLVFTWNFPPGLPTLRDSKARTTVTIALTPEGKYTRVRLTAAGWKDGADWRAGHAYFDKAWTTVLARLERSFRRGPIDWKFGWKPVSPVALDFLKGTWRGKDGDAEVEETWVGDSGGLGCLSRVTRDGRVTFSETAEVSVDGEEVILALRLFGPGLVDAKQSKGGPLLFVLETVDAKSATFVRPGADEVIQYTLEGDTLTGTFTAKGQERARHVLQRVR
ncbi:MAG: hypothetical protein AMXMBFR34_07210 [Myxococcaceae bacterium]